jgi:plasmid stability protein
MTNLTLTIDDELLKRARIRALEQDTSVNALVREYLEQLAARRPDREGMDSFLAMTESIHAGSGPGGRSWTRDELYER